MADMLTRGRKLLLSRVLEEISSNNSIYIILYGKYYINYT